MGSLEFVSWGLGLRVQGLGPGVKELGFRVQRSGFRILGSRSEFEVHKLCERLDASRAQT